MIACGNFAERYIRKFGPQRQYCGGLILRDPRKGDQKPKARVQEEERQQPILKRTCAPAFKFAHEPKENIGASKVDEPPNGVACAPALSRLW
jgi:hypothetical protein